MTTRRAHGLNDGSAARAHHVAAVSAPKSARIKALVGLAAAASVLTAGCTPLVTLGGGGTTKSLALAPISDSFVYANSPDRNMGTDPRLVARSVSGSEKTAFLMVDVQGIPAGSPVAAHLLLTRTRHHPPAVVRVSTASNGWSESGVTQRNAPGVGTTVVD